MAAVTNGVQILDQNGNPIATGPGVPVTVTNVNTNGQATKANSSPVVPASDWFGPVQLVDGTITTQKLAIDASGRLTVVNLAQLAGTVPLLETQAGIVGGVVTEDLIRRMTLAGNAYSATTGKLTAPAAATLGFQLFNPASGTKNLLIYRLIISNVGGGLHQVFKTAANVNTIAGWTDVAATITNNGASATASTATASYSNVALTGGLLGTAHAAPAGPANTSVDVLQNGACIWLPAGAGAIAGIAVYFNAAGANAWSVTAEYLEF